MHCEGKLKLRSHTTSYCLIEVVTKAGLTVYKFGGNQFVFNQYIEYDKENYYNYRRHSLGTIYGLWWQKCLISTHELF
jgi:hypothetical protein